MGRLKKDTMQSAAEALSATITAARINDEVVIDDLRKQVEVQDITVPRARLIIEYDIPATITNITKIELIGSTTTAITTASLNIQVVPPLTMSHVLYAQEGGGGNG